MRCRRVRSVPSRRRFCFPPSPSFFCPLPSQRQEDCTRRGRCPSALCVGGNGLVFGRRGCEVGGERERVSERVCVCVCGGGGGRGYYALCAPGFFGSSVLPDSFQNVWENVTALKRVGGRGEGEGGVRGLHRAFFLLLCLVVLLLFLCVCVCVCVCFYCCLHGASMRGISCWIFEVRSLAYSQAVVSVSLAAM